MSGTTATGNQNLKPSKGLAMTYLVRFSIGSPSGGRSEIENLNVIKKIREGFLDFPYASSQAMKRALRDTLKGLGYTPLSPIINSSPAKTVGDPRSYIDDDLFGYMDASSKKSGNNEADRLNGTRKAVISMTPLISLSGFQDNVDFGANMMGLRTGGNPMPYETEVHRGWYRVSLYVDLDRVGNGDGFVKEIKVVKEGVKPEDLQKEGLETYDFLEEKNDAFTLKKIEYNPLDNDTRYHRAKALIDAIRFLAPSGRSSSWLVDLTPKLMVATYVKGAKTPFLETQLLKQAGAEEARIDLDAIDQVRVNLSDGIEELAVGHREDLFDHDYGAGTLKNMKATFDAVDGWLKRHFDVDSDSTQNSSSQTKLKS